MNNHYWYNLFITLSVLPLSGPSYVFLAGASTWIAFHMYDNCTPSYHCEPFCGQAYSVSGQTLYHRYHRPMAFLLCALFYEAPTDSYWQTYMNKLFFTVWLFILILPSFTEFANPGFISRWMRLFLMSCDTWLHWKALATDVTHVWPLSPVHPHMAYKIGLPTKGGITLITFEWSQVSILMCLLIT